MNQKKISNMTREEALQAIKEKMDYYESDKRLRGAIETLIPELSESVEDERIRKEIDTLYSEIDTCISELLKARTDKDSEAEGKALFKMEGLMVATLQDLSCIEDYLEKQKEQKPAEWSEEDEKPFNDVLSGLKYAYEDLINNKSFDSSKDIKEAFDWMQARVKRFRPSWKPSEEQMGALWKIMKYAVSLSSYYNIQKEIESLYNDLNKLK